MEKRSGCLYRAAAVFVGTTIWLLLNHGLKLSLVFSFFIASVTAIVFWLVLEGRAERKSKWTNLNRIYNLYLMRDREMMSVPCTQIILCDTHAKRFKKKVKKDPGTNIYRTCLLYTSPSPQDRQRSRMPSSA